MAPVFLSFNPSKVDEDNFIEYLKDVYTDMESPVAYSAPATILSYIKKDNKYTNVGLTRLRRYLSIFDGYSLNKQRHISHKNTRRYGIMRKLSHVECDLLSIRRFAAYNDNFEYILVLVDVFSKLGFAEPLKIKRAETVVIALTKILDQLPYMPKVHHSDLGSEFTATVYKRNLSDRNIRQTIFTRYSSRGFYPNP